MATTPIDAKTLLTATLAVLAAEAAAALLTAGIPLNPVLVLGSLRLFQSVLIIAVAHRWGGGLAAIGLGPTHLAAGFKKGLIWSAAFGLAASIGWVALWMAGVDGLAWIRFPLPQRPLDRAYFFVIGGAVAPVAEEFFFRGLLYGFLSRWGKWTAVVLSTLIFALVHPIAGLPVTQAVGGVVFALAYASARSLLAPIIIHVLGNLALFSLSLGS